MRFTGGFRTPNLFNATMPLGELEALADRLVFRLRFGMGRVAGPWVVARVDVLLVRVSGRGSLFGSGVRITTGDGSEWVFWTQSPDLVQEHLLALGYPA